MPEPSSGGTERKTDRLEAFSDAVLAIAVTLPIVDLKPPIPVREATSRRGTPGWPRSIWPTP